MAQTNPYNSIKDSQANWRQLEHRLDRLEFDVRLSSHALRKLAGPSTRTGARPSPDPSSSSNSNQINDDEQLGERDNELGGSRSQLEQLAFEQSMLEGRLAAVSSRMDLVDKFVAASIGRVSRSISGGQPAPNVEGQPSEGPLTVFGDRFAFATLVWPPKTRTSFRVSRVDAVERPPTLEFVLRNP